MIVLDTNIVSELLRPVAAVSVVAYLNALDAHEAHLTSMTVAELMAGVARLPAGERRRRLGEAVDGMVNEDFRNRILPFTGSADAEFYAGILALRERAGRPIHAADALIASIALAHQATLATRNGKDFADIGLDLVNPWET